MEESGEGGDEGSESVEGTSEERKIEKKVMKKRKKEKKKAKADESKNNDFDLDVAENFVHQATGAASKPLKQPPKIVFESDLFKVYNLFKNFVVY